MITASLLALMATLTSIVLPVFIARIIDGPIARRDLAGALAPALLVLVFGVLEAAGIWGRRWLFAGPAAKFEVTMRAKLFRKLQALAIGRHDAWESGQLLSRAVEDLATLRRFIAFAGPFLIIHMVIIPVGIVVLWSLNWVMGLAFSVLAVPLGIMCVRFERDYAVASRRSQDLSGDLATAAEESAQGVRVLKAFGRGVFFGSRWTALSRELQGSQMVQVRLDAKLWASLNGLSHLMTAFALGYGGWAVVQGSMTLGTLVACITLAKFLQWPIIWTGFLLTELTDSRTAADRYWEIIDTPVDITDPAQPVTLPERMTGELRLEGVRFAFPNQSGGREVEVLRDISLTVRPGETVALVGATGSGKTALLNLIPRLYDVTGGTITVDGIDIAAISLADLRALVTVAFEDPVLFSASVRENVALGDPSATDAQVRRALEVAQAEEFVDNLPWGLDTRIGEQGMSLSGGQRQRLALARAVLGRGARGGRIVVLDDPLSALDVVTEEKVQARLRTVLADATTLLVAHRPSTAALADRVALLADGRIVAEGTHEQLLHSSAEYRELMGGEP
ncbi:ABC transporter ATP-binding protein [Nocardia panacis]|uniref:ABC transporter ATP-binding protein n=2 Tax=Nocardia panacis TaxID=2340916 RepID=A0A3A4KUT3_9NOCA|nr:ABC transporter ATP-binding protein [Nocardia panacis]RJO80253.1 ABC transporter ATP-binding protein [Nocardia panacis]